MDRDYKLLTGEICATPDGRHYDFMRRVFVQYLQKESATAALVNDLFFQSFLPKCQTMDVFQSTFDLLLRRMDDKMTTNLFCNVVNRMNDLEGDSLSSSKVRPPVLTLAVPTHWLRLVSVPDKLAATHVEFLLLVLHPGTNTGNCWEPMLGTQRPTILLEHFGLRCVGCPWRVTNRQPRSPDLTVFGNVSFASVAQLLPRGDGASIGNPEEASRYLAQGTDVEEEHVQQGPSAEA